MALCGETYVGLESDGYLHSSDGDVDAEHVLYFEVAVHRSAILREIPFDDLIDDDHQVNRNVWYLLLEVPDRGRRLEYSNEIVEGLDLHVELLLVVLDELLERLVQAGIQALFRQVVLELEGCE